MREQIGRFNDKYSGKCSFLAHQVQAAEQAMKDAERNKMEGDWEMSLACLGIAIKVITSAIEAVAPYHEEMRMELLDIYTGIDDATCELLDCIKGRNRLL